MVRAQLLREDTKRKARLVSYLLAAVGMAVGLVGLVRMPKMGLTITPGLAFSAVVFALLIFVRRGGSHRLAAQLMLWASWLTLVGLAAAAPRARGALLPWLLCLPINAALMIGARQAATWTFLSAAGVVAPLLLERWVPRFDLVDRLPEVGMELTVLGALLITGTATALGEHMRLTTLGKLAKAREAVEAARDQAEEASRHKTRFVANMSHEIRTPMNGVLGMLQLFDDAELSPVQRERLQTIRESADSLLQIINEVLDFSRIEAGHLEAQRDQPVALRALADSLASLLRPAAATKGVDLTVEVDEAVPPVVLSDHGKLRQVLMNLVGNATKFTEQGRVLLRITTPEPGRYRFAVEDTGPGISPGAQQRIFEAFAQEDASTTRRHGGTGLGLAIARAFVAALGGELRVASEQGVGSRFFFELALDRGEDLPESEMPLSRDPQTLPGARVLVAEDDAVNRLVIGAMLGKLGLEHHIVGDGAEAFEAIASDDWDVVLMDVQMPEIDGYEVTRRVRELPEGRRAVPIVALTANALEQDRADAEAAGMDGFLGKPVKLEQLHRVLSRMLRRKRAKAAVALPVEPRQARAHG